MIHFRALNRRIVFLLIAIFTLGSSYAQPVQPYGPTPSKDQLNWEGMGFYLFMHFGPNTFTNLEWGKGTENPDLFHPTALDCDQWARVARDAGAKGIIITAKHHDGFCLWPSKQSTHTVRESKWRNGQGDVLKELSAACQRYGLKFGVYISPWDRNHPAYGTPKYNKIYIKTMKEIFHHYGPIFELWWDGANGEGPNGKKQIYDFPRFERVVRKMSPHTVIFSDIGPDMRWVGNEQGVAGFTNWDLLDTAGFKRGAGGPPVDTLNRGNFNGKNFIPAECDVSIRPGWFYHASENEKVKNADELMSLYLLSTGRGSNLLLNVPPDTEGRIHADDSAALMNFRKLRESFFARNLALGAAVKVSVSREGYQPAALTDGKRETYWAAPDDARTCEIDLDLGAARTFNSLLLQEPVELGQRIFGFEFEVWNGQQYVTVAKGTTIGYKRILQFPEQQASKIRLRITASKAAPVLGEIQLYEAPKILPAGERTH